MKLYELTYLSLPELSEEEQKNLSEKVISSLETPPVSQHFNGFFTTMDFNQEPEKITEIEGKLKEEKQIKKYLLIRKKPVRFKARILRRAEFSKKTEKETNKPKVELQEIEKKLDEILNE